ncbi:hypothetical protein D3C76_876430 [compost metagenome]
MDRLLGLALTVGTPTGRRLGRGFLLGLDQLHGQGQGPPVILVQRFVEAPLLSGVEQGAVGRVQVQQPIVAIDGDQRAVGGDAAGHAGDRQVREQLQPLQGQAGGRRCGRLRLGFCGRLGGVLAGQLVEVAVGRVHVWLDVIFVQRRLVIQVHARRGGIDFGHRRLWNGRGGPLRRVRHHAVRRRQRHRRQLGLLAGGFQHRLDGGLLNDFRLDRIIPRQVDHCFDHDRLDDRLRHRLGFRLGHNDRSRWRRCRSLCRNGRSGY